MSVMSSEVCVGSTVLSRRNTMTPANLTEDVLIEQLDAVTAALGELQLQSKHDDLSGLPVNLYMQVLTMADAAVKRLAPISSAYARQMSQIVEAKGYERLKMLSAIGVIEALRRDIAAGYVHSVEELLHGELFGDFLSMADHLLNEAYKDAAAVIAGSTLEAHLRTLCEKHGIDIEYSRAGELRPKKADLLNAELVKAEAYSKLDQKNVSAWLDLRNKAAHGHYDEYEKDQVGLMISGIRDFVTRLPA